MQLEVLTPFIVAKKHEIPMVVASPSMGPFDNDANKNMLRKELIGYVQKCCIRESISSEYLRSIRVVDNVITTIDTAFYDDPDKTENDKIFKNDESLVNFFGNYNRVVALTLFDLKWQWFISESKDDNLIMKIEEAIYRFIRFLEEQNVGVLLVPQLFGNQNDKDYLKKFGNSRNAYILSDMYDTYMQQYVISKCFALIGMRYHSNIFAAKMGVPFVAIAYEEKMIGFMKDNCLEDLMVTLTEFSYAKLIEKWELLIGKYTEKKEYLKSQREKWRGKSAITISAIFEQIDKLHEISEEKY